MNYWLVKTEPGSYAFDDLLREKSTVWTGVSNALAQKHLRAMQMGDQIFVYHSGKERAIVGLARASSAPFPDPSDPSGTRAAIDIEPIRRFPRPMTLADIKDRTEFSGFDLIRISRLSVMPVPHDLPSRILHHTDSL